jgi:type I restriction enzyme, S subunit
MEVFDKKIGDLVEYIVDNRGKTPPLAQGGYELIETTSIVGQNKYPNYDKISKFVDENTYNNWFRKGHPKAGDILIATVGANIGNISIMRKDRGCVAQNLVALRTNSKIADADFLYYFLSSEDNQRTLKKLDIGAAQPSIKVPHLLGTVVRVPDVMTQQKIATILSAYDDLIENNLRRIKILEEMAQNFYREWFVNFRFPGHEKARFVDSPLGRIPEGWKVKKLMDVLTFNYGKALKKSDRRGGKVPVYGSSGVVGYHNEYVAKGPGIIVGRKGNIGSIYWSELDFYPIDTVYYVISTMPLRFLFYELQNKNFINNDAAVPGLNRNQAYSLELIVPLESIVLEFCRIADSFEAEALILRKKNDTLRQTCDLLLPKLISGEVDVTELDIFVPEEAAS